MQDVLESESMIDLQFEPHTITVPASADITNSDVITTDVHMQPKIITVKVIIQVFNFKIYYIEFLYYEQNIFISLYAMNIVKKINF